MIICLCCCRSLSSLSSRSHLPEKAEKESSEHIPTPCCQAAICFLCIEKNPRLAEYCPRCQLRYTDDPSQSAFSASPPPYDPAPPFYFALNKLALPPLTGSKEGGCIHYLRQRDTLAGISIAYEIPVSEIRRANKLFGNDNLIHARHYLVIPGYTGPSLSREPEDDEESEMRKVALKRFQLMSKCVDYKMATIYMQSSDWNIESALQKYHDDLEWEKANPRRDRKKLYVLTACDNWGHTQ